MRKKKRLLVILGAGSSVECGMPGVSELDDLMRGWAADEARSKGTTDFFALAWSSLAAHLKQGFSIEESMPDFERALSEVLALMQWVRPPGVGSALRTLVAGEQMPPTIRFDTGGPYAPYIGVKTFVSELLARLAEHMREKCVVLDKRATGVARWQTLLNGLRSSFDLAIYNLNYDSIAHLCWPDAFTGFSDEGDFDARAFHGRDWQGLMHLHGSVHFSLRENLGEEIIWRESLRDKFYDCDVGRSADEKTDGKELPRTTLVAGGFKLDQLLVEPFNSYQSGLVRDAYVADAILVGGYGFTDAHVNRALRNALVRRNQERPPVLVLDWANNQVDAVAFRHDRWSHILAQTLYAPAALFCAPATSAVWSVEELKAARACEVTPQNRTAIWYNGFLEASSDWQRMGDWLAGGPDHLLLARDTA